MANAEVVEEVRCLIIPLQGEQLLLPNTTVAEVTAYDGFVEGEGYPDWLLGTVGWRGLSLPLVSFEILLGQPAPDVAGRSQVAVINTLYQKQGLPFFAILASGIPHLARAGMANVAPAEGETGEMGSARVEVAGESAIIPDLEKLENAIKASGIDVKFDRKTLSLNRNGD